mgnify:CR=1 FL=1
MTTNLLETLRALAPVVTPGEWIASESDMFGDHNIQWKEGVETDTDHSAIAAVVSNLRPWQQVEANAQLIVTLRNALPELIAALEVVDLVRDEDWLAERISDSLDVDWRPLDAARAIIAALPKETDNAHD